MTVASLTRRTVLSAVPAFALLSPPGLIRRALAQDVGAFAEQLNASRDIAINLDDRVREVRGRVDAEMASVLQELDYRGRYGLATAASGLDQSQLRENVREEFGQAADMMRAQAVPLIPTPESIIRISTLRTPGGDSCPSVGTVVWDILFDALGLLEEREFFMAALNAVDGTTQRVERISVALNEDQWEQAVDGFFDLLEFLFEGGTVIMLARMLDERRARRFLRAVAIRLVPFFGTGYAIAAFGMAVHRHWNRLFCSR